MAIPQQGGDPQVFQMDGVVGAQQRQCRRVVEVGPPSLHRLVCAGKTRDGLAAAVAALLAAGDAALRLRHPLLPPPMVARVLHDLAVRRDEERPEADVDARLLPAGGNGSVGTSAHEKQTYQPSASLLSVTVLGVPCRGRDQWTLMRPILESMRYPFSRRAPLPYSL